MALALRIALAGIALAVAWIAWSAEKSAVPAAGSEALLARAVEIPDLLKAGRISADEVPDPHWREDACIACHTAKPTPGRLALRETDSVKLCNSCHEGISAHSYIHAVGMVPSEEKRKRMSKTFREALERGGGVLGCIGCHDLPMQCESSRRDERKLNPKFFRGGPYSERTDLCFACHDPVNYERLNPHDQISDEGELNSKVCLVCHTVVPNRRLVRSIDDVQFNVPGSLNKLCLGCHPWRPHPASSMFHFSGPNPHLVKPPEEIMERMQASQQKKNMVLPLDPASGEIFCATCHNPHERGVQQDEAADRGADGVFRLRAADGEDRGCTACHPY